MSGTSTNCDLYWKVVRSHFLSYSEKKFRHLYQPTTEGTHFHLWIILNIRSVLSSTIFENFMWYGYTFYNFRISCTAFIVGGGVFIENKATISGFRQQGTNSSIREDRMRPHWQIQLDVHSWDRNVLSLRQRQVINSFRSIRFIVFEGLEFFRLAFENYTKL